jgi:hypothetical protein
METTFGRGALTSLDAEARSARVAALRLALMDRLSIVASAGEFFAQSRGLVEELRALGHDLWSFDSDGEEFETWCGDWTRSGGGSLTITFRYPVQVEVAWREDRVDAG